MTFNYNNINKLEDLNYFSDLIKKGIIKMPNISKLSKHLNADRKTVRRYLNGFKPSTTKF